MNRVLRVAGSLLLATIVAAGISLIPQKKVAATGDVVIDKSNFPDFCFRKRVNALDKNHDGILSEEEVASVETLQLYRVLQDDVIYDLKGIEYFTQLKYLDCSGHELTSLDLSKNVKLLDLHCESNKLTSLNVSYCKDLTNLYCASNKLTNLDVSGCKDLAWLDCRENQLTSLDVSKNTCLNKLWCEKNRLTGLDVSKNTNLEILYCGSNQIVSLDVSTNVKLQDLSCEENQLANLDVSANVNLLYLSCQKNQLASLDMSNNTVLVILECYENQLTSLDVSKNTELKDLFCFSNKLTSLDVSQSANLINLDCSVNELTELITDNNPKLTELYCGSNQLESLDLSNNPYICRVYCNKNQLVSLYLVEHPYLIDLNCSCNKLTSLDVSKIVELRFLSCYGNEIIDLNIKNARNLNLLCKTQKRHDDTRDGINIYVYDKYETSATGESYCDLELAIDTYTNLWTEDKQPTSTPTPKPYLLSVEIDLSKGDISYSGSKALQDAVSVLLEKSEEEGLFSATLDSANQIIHMDLDSDGNVDVDYLLVGSTFLKKVDTCSLKDEIVFADEQLKNTDYKSISFVFDQYYKVTFDANGGSGEMEPKRAFSGKKFILPDCGFTAEKGKEFSGWDLGAVGDPVDITADTVIKAQWKEAIYSVIVATDGNGKASATVDSGKMGTEVSLKAEPKEGYKFKEWKVVSGGVTITGNKFVIGTENIVIKAYFEKLPATPTPTPKPGDPTPTPNPEKEPSIADFVERLYTIALNRASEPEGKAFWVKEIEDGNRTGGDCAYFFLIEAPEFKNRGLSDEDFVETLYKTFFDRDSEADGKAFWVGQLKNKTMTRDQVIMGFIDSKEWCNVCATYGVKSGAPTAKAEIASKNAINFATRLYTCCLGRAAEDGGLKYWSLALTNLEQTGCSAAKEFFTGEEFVNLKLKNEEYIRRLYTTFMDREPKAEEVSYWAGEIKAGRQTKDSTLAFFGSSEEFTNICKKYGIDRGTI